MIGRSRPAHLLTIQQLTKSTLFESKIRYNQFFVFSTVTTICGTYAASLEGRDIEVPLIELHN